MTSEPRPFAVYHIESFPAGDNHFVTDRSENWIVRQPKQSEYFSDLESARAYVRTKSRVFTDLPLFLCGSSVSSSDQIVDAFCFDDPKYLKYRRFFIGPPPLREIQQALRKDGVQVLNITDART